MCRKAKLIDIFRWSYLLAQNPMKPIHLCISDTYIVYATWIYTAEKVGIGFLVILLILFSYSCFKYIFVLPSFFTNDLYNLLCAIEPEYNI